MRSLAVVAVFWMLGTAHAEPMERGKLPGYFASLTAGIWPGGGDVEGTPPRLVLAPGGLILAPAALSDAASPLSQFGEPGTAIIGSAAAGKATWVATDIDYVFPCGMEGCDKMIAPVVHGVALFDANQHAVAWSLGLVVAGSTTPGKPSPRIKTLAPAALPTAIDHAAEPAVALFKSSIGDPEALARTITDRKDAMLFGSELAEHFAGGDAIRATLRRWKLGFTVRDGIQAGTASPTTVWIAANVDAARRGQPGSTPYRVFAVYDRTSAGWQLVVLQFSAVADIKS